MAACARDDDRLHDTLYVRPEGLVKFQKAIENPRRPTEKLIQLMRLRKDKNSAKK